MTLWFIIKISSDRKLAARWETILTFGDILKLINSEVFFYDLSNLGLQMLSFFCETNSLKKWIVFSNNTRKFRGNSSPEKQYLSFLVDVNVCLLNSRKEKLANFYLYGSLSSWTFVGFWLYFAKLLKNLECLFRRFIFPPNVNKRFLKSWKSFQIVYSSGS